MADRSVRIAWADDAPAIAHLQAKSWRELYLDTIGPDALPDPSATTAVWRASLSKPKDARNRVLVALEGNRVVGFAITVPASDTDRDSVVDGEVAEFSVDQDARGLGHGSRLLQAAVDTMVADRFSRASAWIVSTDDERRRFLTAVGWEPDGGHRELAVDANSEVTLKQVRLHAAIA